MKTELVTITANVQLFVASELTVAIVNYSLSVRVCVRVCAE